MEWAIQNVRTPSGVPADIVIEAGRIRALAAPGSYRGGRRMDGTGLYVSAGWIDLHTHAVRELVPYGDDIDDIGIRSGVTTIVDAGSCGADRIADLRARAASTRTRVLSLLNIAHIGLARVDELSRPEWLDEGKARAAIGSNAGFVVGLKARISRSVVREQGLAPLKVARAWADRYGVPLMVHIGSGPPAVADILPLLQPGDVVTHYLHGKPNGLFASDGAPEPALLAALARGARLDVGHGTASFSFDAAERARRAGIHPHTISTDIYRGNRLNGPVYSLADTMSKFLLLGYSLPEVVAMVTERPADWLGRPELGRIRAGGPAELTLFALRRGARRLTDSEGQTRIAELYIEAKGAVVDGEYFAC